MGPELEKDRQPAVVVLPTRGCLGDDRQHRLVGTAVPRERPLHVLQIALDPPLVDREEQVFLRGEVRIDGALGVARFVRHRVERRRMEALGGEEPLGRVDEAPPGVRLALRPGQSGSHTASSQIPTVSVKPRAS
jgi:hypothetical protein